MLGTTCSSCHGVPSLKYSTDLLAQLFVHASSKRLTRSSHFDHLVNLGFLRGKNMLC